MNFEEMYKSTSTQKIFKYYRNKYFIVSKEIGLDEFNSLLDESFLRAWRKYDKSVTNANFGKFLCGSIQLNINNRLRTRGYDWYKADMDKVSLNTLVIQDGENTTEFIDVLVDNTSTTFEIEDAIEYIKDKVGLKPTEVKVLKLHVIDNLRCCDIEQKYNIPYTALSAVCRRIRNKMKNDKNFEKEVRKLCIN